MQQKVSAAHEGVTDWDKNSLLFRLYAYWVSLGGKQAPDYDNNLCHFVRSATLGLAWRWFFLAHAEEPTVLAPWSVTLAVAVVACFYFWFGMTVAVIAFLAKWLVLGLIAVFLFFMVVEILVRLITSEPSADLWDWFVTNVIEPVIYGIGDGLVALGRLLTKRFLKLPIWLWMIIVAVAALLVFIPGSRIVILVMVLYIASSAGAGAAFVLLCIGIRNLYERFAPETVEVVPTGLSRSIRRGVRVSAAYIKAKHAKICPYVKLHGFDEYLAQVKSGR